MRSGDVHKYAYLLVDICYVCGAVYFAKHYICVESSALVAIHEEMALDQAQDDACYLLFQTIVEVKAAIARLHAIAALPVAWSSREAIVAGNNVLNGNKGYFSQLFVLEQIKGLPVSVSDHVP